MSLSTNNSISLPDERHLGYAEYGEADGFPVFMFHGNPGSRLSWGYFPDCPFIEGIRIIAPDRPGYGLSDFKDNAIESWPDDICALADHLGIEKFTVLGVSGGGPYALACAWKIPDCLYAVGLAGSVGPNVPDANEGVIKSLRILWKVAKPLFWLVKLQMRLMARIAKRNPEKLMKQLRNLELSDKDKEVFDKPEIQRIFIHDFPEAYRQNGIGSAYDSTIPGNWPIPLDKIKIQVNIWSMEADQLVGNMGRYLANTIPNCKASFIPDRGHLWVVENMNKVLADLVPARNSDSKGAKQA
jgi:pimeloyl-ACP methyl ester carboxylesterase